MGPNDDHPAARASASARASVDSAGPDDALLRRASTSSASSVSSFSSDASLTTAESTPASFQTASIGHGIALDGPLVARQAYEPVPRASHEGREELAGEGEHDAEVLATPRPGHANLTPTPRTAAQMTTPPPIPGIPDAERLYPRDADEAAFARYAATTGRPLTRSLTLEEAERATRTLEQEKDAFASTEGSAFSSSGHSSHAPRASVSSSSHAPHAPHPPQAPAQAKGRAQLQSLFTEPPEPSTSYSNPNPYAPYSHYGESSATISNAHGMEHHPYGHGYGGYGASRNGLAGSPIAMSAASGLGTLYGNSTRTFRIDGTDEEKAALAEEEKDTLQAVADVEAPGPGAGFSSALLNLPPPPPFDLRVEALTVGVPVVRFERIAK